MAVLPILLASNAPDFSEAALKNDGRKIISRKFEFKIKKKNKKDVCNCSFMGKTGEGSGSCIFASQQMVKLRNFYCPKNVGMYFPVPLRCLAWAPWALSERTALSKVAPPLPGAPRRPLNGYGGARPTLPSSCQDPGRPQTMLMEALL